MTRKIKNLLLISITCLLVWTNTSFAQLEKLSNSSYAHFNTFYEMVNILELFNPSTESINIEVSIYDKRNTLIQKFSTLLSANEQKDIIINDLPSFNQIGHDNYGTVKVSILSGLGAIDGRISLYGTTNSNGSPFLAFSAPLTNSFKGETYAISNSHNLKQEKNPTPCWLQITNTDITNKNFKINLFNSTGIKEKEYNFTLKPLERRDLAAGHEQGQNVYLVEVIPEDSNGKYIANLARYGLDGLNINYASLQFTRHGKERNLFSIISQKNNQNLKSDHWIEVANAGNQTTSVRAVFRNSLGQIIKQQNISLAPKAQNHIAAHNFLEKSEDTLSVEIETELGSRIIANSAAYVFKNNILHTAYVIPALSCSPSPTSNSFNNFLNQSNELLIFNCSENLANISFEAESTLTNFSVEPKNLKNLNNFVSAQNTYGGLRLSPSTSNRLIISFSSRTSKIDNSNYNFIHPTLSRNISEITLQDVDISDIANQKVTDINTPPEITLTPQIILDHVDILIGRLSDCSDRLYSLTIDNSSLNSPLPTLTNDTYYICVISVDISGKEHVQTASFDYRANTCTGIDLSNLPYANSDDLAAGTITNPYLICSKEQLENVNLNLSSHFKLIGNIDLSSTETEGTLIDPIPLSTGDEYYTGWEPIGDTLNPFTGTFDGNNLKIQNLMMNHTGDNIGLFGVIEPNIDPLNSGIIKNLVIENAQINTRIETQTTSNAGALIGVNNGLIENIRGSGTVKCLNGCGLIVGHNRKTIVKTDSTGEVFSYGYHGSGIAGDNRGDIYYAHSNANIHGNHYVGGIAGLHYRDGINNQLAVISNSFFDGAIFADLGSSSGREQFGGIAGRVDKAIIRNSYSSADIDGLSANNVGGLAGYMLHGLIRDSYSTGDVFGQDSTGGFIGFVTNYEGSSTYTSNDGETVTGSLILRSYSSGTVTASNNSGGFVGFNRGIIRQSFSNSDISGNSNIGGFVGLQYGESWGRWAQIYDSYANGSVNGNSNSAGFAGRVDSSVIRRNYSSGLVNGLTTVGGFAASHCCTTSYSDNYWNTDTSGLTSNLAGTATGIDSIAMSLESTFSPAWDFSATGPWQMPISGFPEVKLEDWDFSNIWEINTDGKTVLKWLNE